MMTVEGDVLVESFEYTFHANPSVVSLPRESAAASTVSPSPSLTLPDWLLQSAPLPVHPLTGEPAAQRFNELWVSCAPVEDWRSLDSSLLDQSYFCGLSSDPPPARAVPMPPEGYSVPAGTCSPLRPGAFEQLLEQHPHRANVDYVLDGLINGFDLHAGPPSQQVLLDHTNVEANRPSALQPDAHRALLAEVQKELEQGRILELDPATDRVFCTPLSMHPKKSDPGAFRSVQDLSAPFGDSVNTTVPAALRKCRLPGLGHVAAMMRRFNRNAWALAADVKGAFRCVNVHERLRFLLGFGVNRRLFCHRSLPLGAALSPRVWDSVAQMIQWIVTDQLRRVLEPERSTEDCIRDPSSFAVLHYVDDFLVLFSSHATGLLGRRVFLDTMAALGVPLAMGKLQFSQVVEYLGFEINLLQQCVCTLPSRAAEILSRVDQARAGAIPSSAKLLSLVGTLNWIALVCPGACAWLSALYKCAYARPRAMAPVLTAEALFELDFWQVALRERLDSAFSVLKSDHTAVVVSDASGFGRLGFYLLQPGQRAPFASLGLPADLRLHEADGSPLATGGVLSTAFLELLGITVALTVFAATLRGQTVVVACDNEAAVQALSRLRSSTPPIAALLKAIGLLCFRFDLTLLPSHLPRDTAPIQLADLLTRSRFLSFQVGMRGAACSAPMDVDPRVLAWALGFVPQGHRPSAQ
jgi:hypothetical protein